ncbi:MAG: DMT family transporter [Propionicimonas sp.]
MTSPVDDAVTPGRIGLYALMTAIWGSSAFFTALALPAFNPFLLVVLRIGIGAVVLGTLVAALRVPLPRQRGLWGHFALLGLISIALPFSLVTWAQVWVDSSMAVVLSGTTPIFVFLLSTVVFRTERLRPVSAAGIVVCFLGVVLLTSGGSGTDGGWFWPLVLVVASGIFAVGNVYTAAFVSGVQPLVVAFLQLGFGTVWLIPVVTLTGSWRVERAGAIELLAVLELGVLASTVAYVIFFYFIRTWGSSATSLNTYLQPVVGVLLGVAVLGERPTPLGWLGFVVIVAGVLLFGLSRLIPRSGQLDPALPGEPSTLPPLPPGEG